MPLLHSLAVSMVVAIFFAAWNLAYVESMYNVTLYRQSIGFCHSSQRTSGASWVPAKHQFERAEARGAAVGAS